ncbi:MAG: hypothetical protein JWO44_2743 [Bacteroidetes bacterium]|nr:hypothetical protein [Bacteroidota bacterium]
MLRPLRTVPLGEYPKFVTGKEYIALLRILRSDLVQKLKLQPAGQNYISTAPLSIEDPLSHYSTALLRTAAKKFLYQDVIFYATPQLTNPLNRSERDALIVSNDTIKGDIPGTYAVLTDHITPQAFEVVCTWEISVMQEEKSSYVPGGLRITRKISAIGIVAGRKKAYCSYEDFKKLCDMGGLDFNSYNQLFNSRTIDTMGIEFDAGN